MQDTISRLVVLLHGYTHTPADLGDVAAEVKKEWPSATLLDPRLPTTRFSLADPNKITVDVAHEIERCWHENGGFDRIILVGHSLGALIARKVYLVAAGEQSRAPFEDTLRCALGVTDGKTFAGYEWCDAIERIVLLAAMNRGWRISHHLSLKRAPLWAAGAILSYVIRFVTGKWPLIMTIQRGAEFITNLRIQWIVLRNAQIGRGGAPGPLTIQLLGSTDDFVAPDDNVDLVSGSNFVYLDVPESNHNTIIQLAGDGAPMARREVFLDALTKSCSELVEVAVIPSDDKIAEPNAKFTNVVFVIHGIRDAGYWTHKIARRVRKLVPEEERDTWAAETSSYGYFPMLPFLLPVRRRQKVEWMMDQYAESLARYPNAEFHYIGHSNGTYLLAKGLELYRACRFGRVVFAGSVVKRRYHWEKALARGQVKSVLNFIATRDWVVALFPRLFEVVPVQDLGSAGHDGFQTTGDSYLTQRTVGGGHGAALKECMWDGIAHFVIGGELPPRESGLRRNWLVVALGMFPPMIWAVITLILFLVWTCVLNPVVGGWWGPKWQGFALAIYLMLILLVLRRV